MMRQKIKLIAILAMLLPAVAGAKVDVVQGEQARKLYAQKKDSSYVLSQLKKVFLLSSLGGKPQSKPRKLTINRGDLLFITNDEKKIIHNIYDKNDGSWILRKQNPGDVAAVTFNEAGTHNIQCAIHPKMKITVVVK